MAYIWGGMLVVGIIVSSFYGRLPEATEAIISGGREAVELAFVMLGVVAMWSGFMRIAEKAGIITGLTRKLRPLLKWLFPSVPEGHPSINYISANLVANFLGLGWAATPPGLMAMKELQKLNGKSKRASKAMCMFLLINMSSVQLISINIIAYRAKFGSQNPVEIIMPCILATIISTITAVLAGKLFERWL